MVTSHSWRSLTPASSSRGRPVWFQEKHGQMCAYRVFGRIPCLCRSDWNLRWLDVCICTDASEKGFASAVREGFRELAQRLTRSSPARTCDQDCISPSLMHQDDGEFDLASHVRVPAVSVHRPVTSLITRDMQRLSHLKSIP